jgi:hypothetical protein
MRVPNSGRTEFQASTLSTWLVSIVKPAILAITGQAAGFMIAVPVFRNCTFG